MGTGGKDMDDFSLNVCVSQACAVIPIGPQNVCFGCRVVGRHRFIL